MASTFVLGLPKLKEVLDLEPTAGSELILIKDVSTSFFQSEKQ